MKKIFSLRRLFFKLIQYLPQEVEHAVIRHLIRINKSDLRNFKFKIANTRDEIEQGFALLYENYLEQGLIPKNPESPYRITKYHLMPTSTMFVAKCGDEVVATVTHVLDSPLGLPCDGATKLHTLRAEKTRLAEISALAIKRKYRRQFSLLFALTRMVYHYSTNYAGCDCWVIVLNKRVAAYYQAIFFFKEIEAPTLGYSFVRDASPACLYAELNELPILFRMHYEYQPESRNLYSFYTQEQPGLDNELPEAVFKSATIPTLTPEMLKYFFTERSNTWMILSPKEKDEVLSAYHDRDYYRVFNHLESTYRNLRRTPRRTIFFTGVIVHNLGHIQTYSKATLLNMSDQGFLMRSLEPLEQGKSFELGIDIAIGMRIFITAQIKASTQSYHYSCQVELGSRELWKSLFLKIEEHTQSLKKPA